MSRAMVRRIRRKMWGGRFDMRIYNDGHMRVRFDHPSNDPEVELAMAGAAIRLIHEKVGDLVAVGPIVWRDDP